MKREQYPKFSHVSGASNPQQQLAMHHSDSKSPDENLSLDDGTSSLFKSTRRNSREEDPDPNEQNESKI